jgi:hypothetical protein
MFCCRKEKAERQRLSMFNYISRLYLQRVWRQQTKVKIKSYSTYIENKYLYTNMSPSENHVCAFLISITFLLSRSISLSWTELLHQSVGIFMDSLREEEGKRVMWNCNEMNGMFGMRNFVKLRTFVKLSESTGKHFLGWVFRFSLSRKPELWWGKSWNFKKDKGASLSKCSCLGDGFWTSTCHSTSLKKQTMIWKLWKAVGVGF